MNDLATLMARPRSLVVAGRRYRIFPQTLGTLGRFQEWLDDQTPEIGSSIRRAVSGLDYQPARWMMSVGRRVASDARPVFGNDNALEVTYTVGGLSELLYLSIRRGRRSVTRKAASDLYWSLGEQEVSPLVHWTIWGDPVGGSGESDSDAIDWWRWYWRLANDPYGYTPRQMSRLTIPQIRCLFSEDGKCPKPEGTMSSYAEYEAYVQAIQADPWYTP